MTSLTNPLQSDAPRVVYCHEDTDPVTVSRILAFRKEKFVDELGWPLAHETDAERDEFDGGATVYCGVFAGNELTGTFRAIRTDNAYLSATKFPELASTLPYPRSDRCWEISRLAARDKTSQSFTNALNCYAAMFQFAVETEAESLVAFCDLRHERLLKRLGIRTRRFGEPRIIGKDQLGRDLKVVAGDIVLSMQSAARIKLLMSSIHMMEIVNETAFPRRFSLSA